jgi:sodium transport system ATP-binding protein
VLSTVLKPDSGTAKIGNIDTMTDPVAVRRSIGVLPHDSGLYPHLTAVENVRYYGQLHGMVGAALETRITNLIERLDMSNIATRHAKGFSQGERTKVALARALVHEPTHVLLDEPTNGLDVMATRQLRAWLKELAEHGCCVLLSSHVMQEIAALADRIVIIARGSVVAEGTRDELAEQFDNTDLEQIFVDAIGERVEEEGEAGS